MYLSGRFNSFKKDIKYTRSRDDHFLHKIGDFNAKVHKRRASTNGTGININYFQQNLVSLIKN